MTAVTRDTMEPPQGTTGSTGPKISSCITRMDSLTLLTRLLSLGCVSGGFPGCC